MLKIVGAMYWMGRVVDTRAGEARVVGLVELDQMRGDVVRVVDWASDGSGSASGRFGWVPADSVELASDGLSQ